MNKKQGLATASLSFAVALLLAGCGDNSIGLNDNSIGAATDLYKAATLTDEQVRTVALGAAKEIDGQHTIAPPSSPYAARLAKITKGHEHEDGLQFNYKVYLTKEINAFAMADGTVRVYSGLLDVMSDDEVRFILGHEIGHAKLGHIRKATQTAYGASAARKAAAASGNQVVSALSASELGSLGETLLNAQFSQSQEYDADAYGIDFLKRNHYSLSAAAAYCNYSKSYFEKMIRGSGLPKYGQNRTRFAQADLDRWMENPNAFLKKAKPAAPRALLPRPEM